MFPWFLSEQQGLEIRSQPGRPVDTRALRRTHCLYMPLYMMLFFMPFMRFEAKRRHPVGFMLLLTLFIILASAVTSHAHDQEIEGEPQDVPAAQHQPCVDGKSGEHSCLNMELVHFVPMIEFGSSNANDVWGWTDPLTGTEYAILGVRNGTAFIKIDEYGHPTYLGRLPTNTRTSSWRDMKVYADHAFIVSEAFQHGMQVFDLTRLRDLDPAALPVTFDSDAIYLEIGSSHNIAINEDTGYAFAVGTHSCRGGLHMIDIASPKNPVFAGCFRSDGYTHDTQCVIYHGPDKNYVGREICFSSNEDTVTITDVTDKSAPVMLARAPYFGSFYTHQGWLTEDHAHFLLDDELDERRTNGATRTFIWDMSNLQAPYVTGVYDGVSTAIDHNQYVRGNHVFQANYRSGIRVLRLGDLSEGEVTEVAFFDTTPADDRPLFSGTWSVYPYFKSGYIVASDIYHGLYILWPRLDAISECSDGIDNDGDGLRDYPEDPTCINADDASESIRFDVEIGLHPKYADKPIVLSGRRKLKLAVLGSPTVNPQDINRRSLLFQPGDVAPRFYKRKSRGNQRDLNRDGAPDLVMRVQLDQTTLSPGEDRICVTGLISGDAFEACLDVTVVENYGKSKKAEHSKGPKHSKKTEPKHHQIKNAKRHGNAPDHPIGFD
jgi:choice-of-anchor B domain-containing protein